MREWDKIAIHWMAIGMIFAAIVFAATALPPIGVGWQKSANQPGGAIAAILWVAWRRGGSRRWTGVPGATGVAIFYLLANLYLRLGV